MLASELEHDPSIRKSATFLEVLKKVIPRRRDKELNTHLRADLERLAFSAPHMLSDIGFERDVKACSPDKEVWRRGTHSVTIYNSTQTVYIRAR